MVSDTIIFFLLVTAIFNPTDTSLGKFSLKANYKSSPELGVEEIKMCEVRPVKIKAIRKELLHHSPFTLPTYCLIYQPECSVPASIPPMCDYVAIPFCLLKDCIPAIISPPFCIICFPCSTGSSSSVYK